MERHYGEARVFVYNMHPVASLDTVPCPVFFYPQNHKETLAGDSIFGRSRYANLPPYRIFLTITDSLRQSCCLTYSIPGENSAPASRETSAS